MNKLTSIFKKDLSRRAFWVLVVVVFAAKAVLGYAQNIYITVGGAPLDDELMFKAAQSISAGNWLGEYNYLTLSKQMFFAVWLAFCHAVHIPYLIAGQLLLCGAALAMAQAFAPVLRTCKSRFALFAALAFSPAAAASFTLRVYRDNIFPSECILLFAGMIGAALRCKRGLRGYWPWLALAGVGLGTARITREDGIWLLPFALVGTAVILVAILREKGLDHKLVRCLAQAVPYGVLAAFVLTISAINYTHYGVFTTSDFSEGSFAAAYGAMTRVEHEEWKPLVPVPKDVREKLYDAVPQLQPLRYWLEEYVPFQIGFMSKEVGDYQAGSFYWVLRRAAQEEGIYETAAGAERYWQTVADAVNTAIDEGVLTASVGKRSSTTPIIRAEYVLPTLQETVRSFFYCLTFRDCSCYCSGEGSMSQALPEDAKLYRDYLGNYVNYAAIEGTGMPYYGTRDLWIYHCFDALIYLYAWLIPVLFAAALAVQLRRLIRMIRTKNADGLLVWLILLGVLGMALLRCAMIAFMEVAAFNIGTYVMYLASVHPLLITYAVAGVLAKPGEKA